MIRAEKARASRAARLSKEERCLGGVEANERALGAVGTQAVPAARQPWARLATASCAASLVTMSTVACDSFVMEPPLAAAGAETGGTFGLQAEGGGAGTEGETPLSADPCGKCLAQGQWCDDRTKECLECIADGDCGADAHCVTHRCLASLECGTGVLDCGSEPGIYCLEGRCAECHQTSDCELTDDGNVCEGNRCVYLCEGDTDCQGAVTEAMTPQPFQLCDNGLCVECRSDADCSAGAICADKRCLRGGTPSP